MSEKLIYITGTIKLESGEETNISLILDDDSVGEQLKSDIVARYDWIEIEEETVDNVIIEKWGISL